MVKRRKAGTKLRITAEGVKKFLKPDKTNAFVFLVIIAVHVFLSFGLAFFDHWYWVFISILYGAFNFPVVFTFLSLKNYNVYILSASAIVPLAGHLIYWYILASFARAVILEKNNEIRYRRAFYLVSMFLAFALLLSLWFSMAFGYEIYNSLIRF